MSSRTWSTAFQRRRFIETTELLGDVIAFFEANGDAFSASESSSSSSSFSSSSSSSSDESIGAETAIIEPLIDLALEQAIEIITPIESSTIQFGQRKLIRDMDASACLNNMRFKKDDLQMFADLLWPRLLPFLPEGSTKDRIPLQWRYTLPYETCLMLVLTRFARPTRLVGDMEQEFGLRKSHISTAIQVFSASVYELAKRYLTDPTIWHSRMPYYAERIYAKTPLLNNIWGFIDATNRKCCRPIVFQRMLYTRYIRGHCIKFQSVVTPDGYIALLHGPFMGRFHDARIVSDTQLIPKLRELMPEDGSNGPVYAPYGDLAYPQSIWLYTGFRAVQDDQLEARFNGMMSSCRIAVEWGFARITQLFAFLDFRKSMKLFQSPIAQYYVNSVFFCNVLNCLYGYQTSEYFECEKLTLEEYLALIDNV